MQIWKQMRLEVGYRESHVLYPSVSRVVFRGVGTDPSTRICAPHSSPNRDGPSFFLLLFAPDAQILYWPRYSASFVLPHQLRLDSRACPWSVLTRRSCPTSWLIKVTLFVSSCIEYGQDIFCLNQAPGSAYQSPVCGAAIRVLFEERFSFSKICRG